MHAVLQSLRDEYECVEGYVRATGLTDDEIGALRADLVDD